MRGRKVNEIMKSDRKNLYNDENIDVYSRQ